MLLKVGFYSSFTSNRTKSVESKFCWVQVFRVKFLKTSRVDYCKRIFSLMKVLFLIKIFQNLFGKDALFV